LLYTYLSGTSTPLATYTDSTQSIANSNPVVLDAQGYADVWIPPNVPYRWRLTTQAAVLVWDRDPISVSSIDSTLLLPVAGIFATATVTLNAVAGGAPLVAAGFFPAHQTILSQQVNITQQFGASAGLTGLSIGDAGSIDRCLNNASLTVGPKPTRSGGFPRFPTATDLWVSPIGGAFDANGQLTLTRLAILF
jgi:hypothetical protein